MFTIKTMLNQCSFFIQIIFFQFSQINRFQITFITGRCFNTRLSEHKRDLKPINLAKLKEDDLNKKTALVKHCFNCEHRIDFGNSEILDYNIDYEKRKFLELLYINNTKNSINDKDRNVFPKIYSNIKNLN